jgi:TolB-like protein
MSFLGEIGRRKVFQVAAVYAVVAWLLVQIVATIEEPLGLPTWFDTAIIVLLGVGFPITLVMSWAFNLTSSGVVRDTGAAAATPGGGRTIEHVLIGLLIVAVGFLLIDNYLLERAAAPAGMGVTTTRISANPDIDEPVDAPGRDLRSIAVLPFDNRSARQEDEFFVDGIHDDIITQLFKIGGLKVISRTSVMEYRDAARNMRDIAEALGVATILEGAVQRSGDAVRINVQLINAHSDGHLWAEIYNRELTAENIFDIQSEMAIAIADSLEATLSPEEVARLSERPTESTEAYNFFLAARDYWRRTDIGGNRLRAADMYERAVAADPEFALAWAELSVAHTLVYWAAEDRVQGRIDAALGAVERAVALQPDLPEAHLAWADYYYRVTREFERALDELELAEEGIPGSAHLHATRAYVLRRLHRFQESHAAWERSVELDPRYITNRWQQAQTFEMLRDYARAEQLVHASLELAPDSDNLYAGLARMTLERNGDTAALAAQLGDSAERNSNDELRYLAWLAAIYDRDFERALGGLAEWEDSSDEAGYFTTGVFWPAASLRAITHRLAGEPALAQPHFETALGLVRQALATNVDDVRLDIAVGEALAGLGDTEAALAAARRAIAAVPTSRDALEGPTYELDAVLRVFLPAGEHDAAIEHLGAYLAGPGRWSVEGLLPDPRLDPIRDDPRFLELVEAHRRP